MMRFLLPLVAFIVLVVFLLIGLNLNPRQVPELFLSTVSTTRTNGTWLCNG